MTLVERDNLVEQISATATDKSLSDTVLPRTLEAGPFGLDPEALDRTDDILIEIGSAIRSDGAGRPILARDSLPTDLPPLDSTDG